MSDEHTVSGSVRDRLADQTTVTSNISQNIIEVTEDKLELCLIKFETSFISRNAWQTPLSIFLAFSLCLLTTNPKDALFLSADVWYASFLICTLLSLFWLIFSILKSPARITINDLIQNIKEETNNSHP